MAQSSVRGACGFVLTANPECNPEMGLFPVWPAASSSINLDIEKLFGPKNDLFSRSRRSRRLGSIPHRRTEKDDQNRQRHSYYM
jgi:hypothetical protein